MERVAGGEGGEVTRFGRDGFDVILLLILVWLVYDGVKTATDLHIWPF